MVLDVSYSRVLSQRPTFYCPLLAVSCPEVWARIYRHIYTVQSMYNVHTKKQNKNVLQPVDGATDGATRRVICPASLSLYRPNAVTESKTRGISRSKTANDRNASLPDVTKITRLCPFRFVSDLLDRRCRTFVLWLYIIVDEGVISQTCIGWQLLARKVGKPTNGN